MPRAKADSAKAAAVAKKPRKTVSRPPRLTAESIDHAHRDELLTRELFDFLALTSHQLRTPLSVIKGYSAMLIDGTFGELPRSQKVILEKVFIASERMIRLVNNFLDLPRMHLGGIPLNKESVSLTRILLHAIAEARLQADIKKIPIEWSSFTQDDPCPVYGDRENLTQAFANLLDNAIKYTSQGSIGVRLERGQGTWKVSITDAGIGIAPAEIPKLFHKFVRGDDMRKLYREGRGLGLYITKQIVDGHGGTITAASPGIGQGSTFTIEIPLSSV